jgi:adenylosuccinate synthase
MINGIAWLVITKLDVLDKMPEVRVCTSYRVNGKETQDIPAQVSGYDKIEPIYTSFPGWQSSTLGITEMGKLPEKALNYLAFLEKETGAKIGVVSTGPDRDQTIFTDEFATAIKAAQAAKPAAGR